MAEPRIAQKGPYVMKVKPGRYSWCACGMSSNQPYCNGTHRGTEFSPIRLEIIEEKQVAWCGCKRSGNKPFCNGTHNKI